MGMNVGYCQSIISRDALPTPIHASIAPGIRKTIQHKPFKMIIIFTYETQKEFEYGDGLLPGMQL